MTAHPYPLEHVILAHPSLSDWNILLCYRGSVAHGMYVSPNDPKGIDDIDLMGICVPPKPYYVGLSEFGSRGTQEIRDYHWDIVVYEARKAIALLMQGNPNVLSLLWIEPEHYLRVSDAGRLLLDNRHLFVGKHVYHSFVGYAHSQLKRMTHFVFEGYMGEKRKRLVEELGYDAKNAAHLIRLLRMGIEFLQTGEMQVRRLDADELLSIKQGKWTLEQIKAEAEKLFDKAKAARDASPLPIGPERERINDLCVSIVETAWRQL